jgi:hypothetical protein
LDVAGSFRDLVFLSYSHADAEWVQRLEVLLKPVVRARRLRVWADAHIRVGDDWRRDLTAAIERTRLGLLLVSADFLASDFIMDEELPALIARGVPLAPVLVEAGARAGARAVGARPGTRRCAAAGCRPTG